MAKRGGKKAKRGGKKAKKHRKNPKRVAAGKKAYKKTGLYKLNKRRGKGKRKGKGRGKSKGYKAKKGTKKSRSYARKASAAGVKVPSKAKIQDAYKRIVDRGGSESHARAVVARLERMRMHAIRKGFEVHAAAQQAAKEKAHALAFADQFRKIAAEEKRRASL